MHVSSKASRLYAPRVDRPLHIALVEPEIPPNTGNVARLCAATGCVLHLIGPLAFRIDEHAVRRAGLDYWEEVELHQHRSYPEAERNLAAARPPNGPPPQAFFFSSRAERSYLDVSYRRGDLLVFGRESVGLPESLLAEHAEHVIGIPLLGRVRSLNLANAVSIAIYEALRQLGLLANARLGELNAP
jgi:tRNA (cytidine/uridine-2'-O-)-methyltransferase